MHKFALLAGKAALAIKEVEINEDGPLYVKIKGRKSGIFAWFLTILGIDNTTTLEVYENRIEFTEGSLSGRVKEMIPLSSICNLGTGYLKPTLLLMLAGFFLLMALPTFGVSLIFTVIFGIFYFLRKSMLLYAIPNSGNGPVILFKRSIIENVSLSEKDAYRIIDLISDLVDKSKKN